jgi:hypothetical protein
MMKSGRSSKTRPWGSLWLPAAFQTMIWEPPWSNAFLTNKANGLAGSTLSGDVGGMKPWKKWPRLTCEHDWLKRTPDH